MPDGLTVARLSIVLDAVLPRVRRCIDFPLNLNFADLHTVLQVVMGWKDQHVYAFTVEGAVYGHARPGSGLRPVDASKMRLQHALAPATRRFSYVYDLGDRWEHRIDIEFIGPAAGTLLYPRLVDAQGRCPPENIGGPIGFGEFLDAIQDPAHPDHRRFLEWHGGPFDPEEVDVTHIQRELTHLARQKQRVDLRSP